MWQPCGAATFSRTRTVRSLTSRRSHASATGWSIFVLSIYTGNLYILLMKSLYLMAQSKLVIWLLMLLLGPRNVCRMLASASSTTAPNFIGEFNKLKFKSIRRDEFRITLSAEDKAASIWAESKNTKSQWQLEVNDVAKHGPSGVPAPVVFAQLKASLLLLNYL